MDEFDIVIIGAGPGGYTSAIRAAQMGGSVALIEEDRIGGVCMNKGCIPTKTMLLRTHLIHEIKQKQLLDIDRFSSHDFYSKISEHKNRVVKQLAIGLDTLIKNHRIRFIKGKARFLNKKSVEIEGENGDGQIVCGKTIIIATGSKPKDLELVKFDGSSVISSYEALELKEIPRRLAIVGCGYVGLEFATIFSTLGSKIVIIEALPYILPSIDEELSRELVKILKNNGIEVYTNARITGAMYNQNSKEKEVSLAFSDSKGEKEIQADVVLITVGRQARIDELRLDKIGVETANGEISVNKKMQTTITGIYAIGDVTGQPMLAHKASEEGLVAVENIFNRNVEMNYHLIPNCVFTNPQVASIGMTEKQAQEKNYRVKKGKFPFRASPMAIAMDQPHGFIKLIVDQDSGEILGVHVIGPHAIDLISASAYVMKMEGTVEDIMGQMQFHPSIGEALREAALDVEGRTINL